MSTFTREPYLKRTVEMARDGTDGWYVVLYVGGIKKYQTLTTNYDKALGWLHSGEWKYK